MHIAHVESSAVRMESSAEHTESSAVRMESSAEPTERETMHPLRWRRNSKQVQRPAAYCLIPLHMDID
jgi:hypothetical protein